MGNIFREFIYCKNAGEAIVETLEKYTDPFKVINIGSGLEITIKQLANIISEEVGYNGEIVWLKDMPSGQRRKRLDLSKSSKILNFPVTDIRRGIQQTVKWYQENKEEADAKSF